MIELQCFDLGDRVRVSSTSGLFGGESGEVMGFRSGWDEDQVIVALDDLADTDMPERMVWQSELELER